MRVYIVVLRNDVRRVIERVFEDRQDAVEYKRIQEEALSSSSNAFYSITDAKVF